MAEQKIKVNDRFTLVYDSQGNKYLLDMKPRGKKGTIQGGAYCGYHLKFEYLLRAFIRKRLPEMEAASVKEALMNMEQIEGEIHQLARNMGEELQEQWKQGKRAAMSDIEDHRGA